MSKRLDALNPGEVAIISQLHIESAQDVLVRRLYAVGFRVGSQVELLRRALAKGPLHVRIGTAEIMLRREEAKLIGIQH